MTTVEILRQAKAEIEAQGWEQGSSHFSSPEGPCCVLGAIVRARARLGIEANAMATTLFRRGVGLDLDRGRSSIPAWNDTAGRTVNEVLAAFDRAIALAEATPAPLSTREG